MFAELSEGWFDVAEAADFVVIEYVEQFAAGVFVGWQRFEA